MSRGPTPQRDGGDPPLNGARGRRPRHGGGAPQASVRSREPGHSNGPHTTKESPCGDSCRTGRWRCRTSSTAPSSCSGTSRSSPPPRTARWRRRSPSGRCACGGWPRRWTRSASRPTDASGTFCWNTARTWSSTWRSRAPAGCCTRSTSGCSPSSSIYIANHAEDEVVFVDRSLLPMFAPLRPQLRTVRHVIVMDDGADCPMPDDPRSATTTSCSRRPSRSTAVRGRRREQAAAMCYTSGTTGNPKGVVYSHRSTLLHSLTRADRRRARPLASAT